MTPLIRCLTDREEAVVLLAAKGYTRGEIASRLGISPHTVKTHADNARHKLGAVNLAHAGEILRTGAA